MRRPRITPGNAEPSMAGSVTIPAEERYRALFEAIDAGFCIVKMLFDDAGRAVDYRFVEVNPKSKTRRG